MFQMEFSLSLIIVLKYSTSTECWWGCPIFEQMVAHQTVVEVVCVFDVFFFLRERLALQPLREHFVLRPKVRERLALQPNYFDLQTQLLKIGKARGCWNLLVEFAVKGEKAYSEPKWVVVVGKRSSCELRGGGCSEVV